MEIMKEGMFKLMVGISGKSTNNSVECTKIFLLTVWNKRNTVLKVEVT